MQPTHHPDAELAARYRRERYWDDVTGDAHLRRSAATWPEATAIVDDDVRLTFAEVDAHATAVAAGLIGLGVTAGDVVAYQLPNWHEAMVVYQAILKIGAVANPIVPIYRGHELRFILSQAGASVAVIPAQHRGTDFVALYAGLQQDIDSLRDVVVVRGEPASGMVGLDRLKTDGDEDEVPARSPAHPDDVALLLYTSGTTAEPKGALHTHNTLGHEARSVRDGFGLDDRDVVFNPSPVTHITGVMCALTVPLLVGCRVVLQDVWDAEVAASRIEREGASFMIFATPFLQGLTNVAGRGQHDLSSVRTIVCGGAGIPAELVQTATERIGLVVRMYGSTEVPSATSGSRWDSQAARATTDGRLLHPTTGRITDAEGNELPSGEVGEVELRGPDGFCGYLDESLNRVAFTADGFFRTGDLATIDEDGLLTIRGRTKDIINRGGEKLSALELENLVHTHEAVAEVAVVSVPDPDLVERACAVVVLEPGASLTLDELADHLRGKEVATQKLPEQLEIVEQLPRTASGKVQKFRLRAMLGLHDVGSDA